jgi:hypothetical protein
MATRFDVASSYRQTVTSGAVTTIAAATASAGHILALRNPTANTRQFRLRSLEVEFILNVAFGAAQEVGFDVSIARSYTAAHTGGTALTLNGNTGKVVGGTGGYDPSTVTGRIASTAALTAGTQTLDTNPIASASVWCAAVGVQLNRFYDFTSMPIGGIILRPDEGIVARNSVLMGASGVGAWRFTYELDEGVLTIT